MFPLPKECIPTGHGEAFIEVELQQLVDLSNSSEDQALVFDTIDTFTFVFGESRDGSQIVKTTERGEDALRLYPLSRNLTRVSNIAEYNYIESFLKTISMGLSRQNPNSILTLARFSKNELRGRCIELLLSLGKKPIPTSLPELMGMQHDLWQDEIAIMNYEKIATQMEALELQKSTDRFINILDYESKVVLGGFIVSQYPLGPVIISGIGSACLGARFGASLQFFDAFPYIIDLFLRANSDCSGPWV